jgi:hypothetical protein
MTINMKNKLVVLTLALVSMLSLAAAIPAATYAAECGGVKTTIDFGCGSVSGDGGTGDAGIYGLMVSIFNFLAIGVGIAVTIGIVYGGLMFMTARGNSGQTQKGVTIITNAVVGLLLYIFMYAIINFLVPGGLFT